MLKRLSTFTLIFILMVATVGVNISIQWCGGEWTGVKINGIHILTEAGKAMQGCCTDDDEGGCDAATRAKIYCYVAMCGLLWSNWCEYKRNLGVEFGEYSLAQYRYAKEFYRYAMSLFAEIA